MACDVVKSLSTDSPLSPIEAPKRDALEIHDWERDSIEEHLKPQLMN